MTHAPMTHQNAMFAEERHRAILERLRDSGKATVEELAAAYQVSAPTIRSDLARLEQQGLLRRTHGGALSVDGTLFDPPNDHREELLHREKRAIARMAADAVKDDETVLLDAGTTTCEIARILKDRRRLTVVTNSLANAAILMENPGIEVILVGGTMQAQRRATLGPLAVRFLTSIHVDRAFLAFNGVHPDAGFTVVDFDAAEVKRQMMARAAEVVVVADSGKIGRSAFAVVAPVSAAHLLMTDDGAPPHVLARIAEQGLPYRVAKAA